MASETANIKIESGANNDNATTPQSGGRYRSRSRSPVDQNKSKPRRDNDRPRNDRNRDQDRNRRDRDRDRRPRMMGDRRGGMGQGGAGRGGPREAVLDRSVFVSNIPYELKWQDLKDVMRKNVGEVTYVEIFTGEDGKSKGCALVEFANRTDVGKACEKMHRHEIEGRNIVVKEDRDGRITRKYRPRVQDEKAAQMMLTPQVLQQLNLEPDCVSDTVFVSNLPYQVTWRKLKDIFKMAGEVAHADIIENENNESRGLATVQFESPLSAVQAISMFNGQTLYDRTMRVRMDKVKAHEDNRERHRKMLPSGLGGLGPTLDMLGPNSGGGMMGPIGGGGRGMGGGFDMGMGGGQGMGSGMGMGNAGGMGMGSGGGGMGISTGGGGMGMGTGGGGMGMGSSGIGLSSSLVGGNSSMGGGLGGNLNLGLGGSLSGGGMGSLGNSGRLGNSGLGSMNSGGMSLGGGGSGGGSFGNGLSSSGMGSFGSGGGGGGGYVGSSSLGSSSMGINSLVGGGGGSMGMSNTGMGYNNNSNMGSDIGMNLSGGRGDFGNFGGNSSILGEPRGQNLRDSGRQNFRDGGGSSCSILVKNLPFSYDWKKLKDSFRHIAPVVYAEVRTENGRSKGYGLVKFEVPADARKAVDEMNRVRFDGREIVVQIHQ